jgi:tetratricopeptide repeat protein/PEGA domain-containing protein
MMRPALLLLTLLLLAPLASAAAPELDPDVDMARSHFRRGVALYRSGAYDAALAEFSRAYESAPNYRILYNLAQIQAQRQDFVQSLELFERYLQEGAGDLPPGREESVQAEIAELRRRTCRLRVDSNVDGARLFVNELPGVELPLEHPLLLNAGIHRLRVEKPGYLPASRTVMLAGGDDSSLTLDLDPELDMDEPAPQPAPPPAPVPPPADRTPLWASLAATGALAGATVTFGVLTSHANAELGERLARYPASRASVETARDRVRTFALMTDTLAVAAAAAAGLSTYFYFSTRDADDGAGATSGVRAQLGPGTSGLWWVGEF